VTPKPRAITRVLAFLYLLAAVVVILDVLIWRP
jgi:hypothetical protein